jgi:hypothetical protein
MFTLASERLIPYRGIIPVNEGKSAGRKGALAGETSLAQRVFNGPLKSQERDAASSS